MSHINKQLRDAIVAALGSPGWTVSSGRVLPIANDAGPVTSVYVRTGTVLEDDQVLGNPKKRFRGLSVSLETSMKTHTPDDDLDDKQVTLEKLMAADITFAGIAIESNLASHELQVEDGTLGEKPVAHLFLNYDVVVRVADDDPETPLS